LERRDVSSSSVCWDVDGRAHSWHFGGLERSASNVIFGLVLNMTAGLLSACAPNVFVMMGLRLVAGVGIGATVPPLFTLVPELAPPSERGFCVTLAASFWMVGSIFVALMAMLFLKNADNNDNHHDGSSLLMSFTLAPWRVFAFACAVPSAVGAGFVFWLVPESPRFLALQGRFDEALDAANILANSLQYTGPSLHSWELEEQFGDAIRSRSNYHPGQSFDEEDGPPPMTTLRWIRLGLADFFVSASKLYTPGLRQTTWPLQMVWFSLSFSSYGLMTWINTLFFAVHLEDVYFNALLFAFSNLPGNMFTGFFLDRTGRDNCWWEVY
jgi:VNT family MFS transporter (synaptic vesicle glycoprotein 2)